MTKLIAYTDDPNIGAYDDKRIKSRFYRATSSGIKSGLHKAEVKLDDGEVVQITIPRPAHTEPQVIVRHKELLRGEDLAPLAGYTASYYAWALRRLYPKKLSPSAMIEQVYENKIGDTVKEPFLRSLWLTSYVNAVLHQHSISEVRDLFYCWDVTSDEKVEVEGFGPMYESEIRGNIWDRLKNAGIEDPGKDHNLTFIESFI